MLVAPGTRHSSALELAAAQALTGVALEEPFPKEVGALATRGACH